MTPAVDQQKVAPTISSTPLRCSWDFMKFKIFNAEYAEKSKRENAEETKLSKNRKRLAQKGPLSEPWRV
jgi:hypothetical protein